MKRREGNSDKVGGVEMRSQERETNNGFENWVSSTQNKMKSKEEKEGTKS